MTAGAFPNFYQFITQSGMNLAKHPTQRSIVDDYLATFFAAYLTVDLLVGTFNYRSQLSILTGWIHHIFYIVLMIHLLHNHLTSPFCLLAILEFPTMVLATGHLWKTLRQDKIFGASFFIFRIAFHGFMIYQFYANFTEHGPWWQVVLSAYPLHIHWFFSWVKQQQRLRLENKEHPGSVVPDEDMIVLFDESILTPRETRKTKKKKN
jgi:hypothetical protein